MGQVQTLSIPDEKKDTALNDSNKDFTVIGSAWKLLAVGAKLITTATVGARQMVLEVLDAAGTIIFKFPIGFTQAASLTYNYTWAPGLLHDAAVILLSGRASLPQELVLPVGYVVRLRDAAAIDAAADDLEGYLLYETIE